MQHFICTGRLCDNPSITQGQKSKRAYFQIAISRDIRKEGAPDADFLNCVAFKDRADFVEKYLRKGMKIEVMGRIETSSYEKDGNRIPTFKVIVSYLNFAESKTANEKYHLEQESHIGNEQASYGNGVSDSDFIPVSDYENEFLGMDALTVCTECGCDVPDTVITCPECGAKMK